MGGGAEKSYSDKVNMADIWGLSEGIAIKMSCKAIIKESFSVPQQLDIIKK